VFPGLNNTGDAASSEGAIGFRVLDTTQFADGLHTIAWVGYDDQGIGEGVGSRYFSILNGSSLKAAPFSTAQMAVSAGGNASMAVATPRASRIWVSRGTDPVAEIRPDASGVARITLGALERMGVQFGAASCVAGVAGPVRDGKLEPLPVGSALKGGRFYWQPGPAFNGDYDLQFAVTECTGAVSMVNLTVTIVPAR
jgi:hypothetical protein